MTGSSSRHRIAAAAGFWLAAIACLAAESALAQSAGTPLLLTPPAASAATGAPGATPPDSAAAPADGTPASPAPSITERPLGAPRPDTLGLLDATGGGFPDGMWEGSHAATARALIAALPHRFAFLSARGLATRFLLSAAPAPAGQEADLAAGGNAGAPMLEARIAALVAIADWQDALALIDLVPPEARDPALAQLRTDGLLILGRSEALCADMRPGQSPDTATQELQVFCQLALHQASAAGLGLAVLREQGLNDKLFFWAADAAQGNAAPPPPDLSQTPTIAPLILALLRLGHTQLPADILARREPTVEMVAAQIALTPAPPVPVPAPPALLAKPGAKKVADASPPSDDEPRLTLIEHAVADGVADPAALRAAYAEITPHPGPDTHVATGSAVDRAMTYQLAAAQSLPAAQGEVIRRVVEASRGLDDGAATMVAALIYAPMVAAIDPSPDTLALAAAATRVLLAADCADLAPAATGGWRARARQWTDLVHASVSSSADAAAADSSLWPYRYLLGAESDAIRGTDLDGWLATVPASVFGNTPLAAEESLLNLLSGIGAVIPDTAWQPFIVAGKVADPAVTAPPPSPALWDSLSFAVQNHRMGEAVAVVLRLLSADAGPPHPLADAKALDSLTALARGADAHTLAVEMALRRGL